MSLKDDIIEKNDISTFCWDINYFFKWQHSFLVSYFKSVRYSLEYFDVYKFNFKWVVN